MTERSRFDPDSGRLRLTHAAVGAIASLTREDAQPTETSVEELRAGGIVAEAGLHPRLVPVGRCFAAPLARLVLEHEMPRPWRLEAWVDDRIAVLLRSTAADGDEPADVVVIPRGMAPLNLARLLALGPRRRVKVDGLVEMDAGLVEALLGFGDGWTPDGIGRLLTEQEPVLPEWLEVLATLSNQPKRRWRMGAWWNSPEESPTARLMEVVEADVGSFLLTHHREQDRPYRRVRLHPLTSTQIWRLLCALLPAPNQIIRPLAD